jgi:hypothetical protein
VQVAKIVQDPGATRVHDVEVEVTDGMAAISAARSAVPPIGVAPAPEIERLAMRAAGCKFQAGQRTTRALAGPGGYRMPSTASRHGSWRT